MRYIIGINGTLHDSSVAAFNRETERLDYFYSEDRHSGVPHHYGFPIASLDELRKKINFEDIAAIALTRNINEYIHPPTNYFAEFESVLRKPIETFLSELYYNPNRIRFSDLFSDGKIFIKKIINEIEIKFNLKQNRLLYFQKKICYLVHNVILEINLLNEIRDFFGNVKIISISHHECHASLAFTSKFSSCGTITWDGRGEFQSTTLGVMDREKMNLIEFHKSIEHPFSIGSFYNLFVEFCGFNRESGPGKLMGLSAYGKPVYEDVFSEMIIDEGNFSFRYNEELLQTCDVEPLKLTKYAKKIIGDPSNDWKDPRIQNIALGAQIAVEKVALKLLSDAKKITGKTKFHFSGGVALNCLMNGKLFNATDEFDIYPACGDDGTSIGACIASHQRMKREEKNHLPTIIENYKPNSLLNLEFKENQILELLRSFGLTYELSNPDNLATLILDNKIISVLNNSYEVGPRALGSRSIIGNAFSPVTWSYINSKIKLREDFRPFAPMVLDEDLKQIFGEKENLTTKYMLSALPVKPDVKKLIPAVVHLNGTARVQSICKNNEFYYELLKSIKRKKSLGICINTSLNMAGESIIDTPKRLIEFFAISELDAIVIGTYLVIKKNNVKSLSCIKKTIKNSCSYLSSRVNFYQNCFSKTGRQDYTFGNTFKDLYG